MSDALYGEFIRALTASKKRMIQDPQILSAASQVCDIGFEDGREAIVYVKIIRYDATTARLNPDSGGLLEDI
jgi:hypothetical protein